jgi:WD40 repeat protein
VDRLRTLTQRQFPYSSVAAVRVKRKKAWPFSFSLSPTSPDGQTLATGWDGGEVRLYDVATGWEVADLRVSVDDFWVRWLGFHPDGRSLAVLGYGPVADQNLSVWDLATRKEIRRMPAVALPGDDQMLVGNKDFWTWFGHKSGAWRADGLLLASCDAREGTVRLWSTDGKPERHQVIRLYPPNTPWLHALTMSPEGRHLATANPDGTITILRLAEPGQVFEPTAPPIPK